MKKYMLIDSLNFFQDQRILYLCYLIILACIFSKYYIPRQFLFMRTKTATLYFVVVFKRKKKNAKSCLANRIRVFFLLMLVLQNINSPGHFVPIFIFFHHREDYLAVLKWNTLLQAKQFSSEVTTLLIFVSLYQQRNTEILISRQL